MKLRFLISGLLGLVAAAGAWAQTNVDVDRYGVTKVKLLTQTTSGAPSFDHYLFEVFVDPKNGGTLNGGSVFDGTNTYTLQASGDLNYESGPYADVTALNVAYPGTTYNFTINGAGGTYTSSLNLAGDVYPSVIPQITNSTWSGGSLLLDNTSASTISFTTFSNMVNSDDAIVMSIEGVFNNSVVGIEFVSRNLTNSFSLAANEMISGNTYNARIGFFKLTDGYESTEQYPGNPIADSQGLAGYSFQTQFQIVAVPEPSTYALIAVGLGLVAIPLLRRRSQG